MKKFFRIGKEKRDKSQDAMSQSGKSGASASRTSRMEQESQSQGYDIKDKELSKLHKAVWNGDLHKVKQLAKKDASPMDKEHRTPLHLACAKGHHLIVKELLEWKAKINVGDSDARTPIMKAVECNHEECVSLLLEDKADPNTKDKTGQTCLHYAASDGFLEIIRILASSEKVDIDVRDNKGNTALHVAVMARQGDASDLLLGLGAEPNIQNGQGRSPLMLAADQGSTPILQLLLKNGADRSLKDKNGWTASDIAVMQGQEEVHHLLQRGPNFSTNKASNLPDTPSKNPPDYVPGGSALDEGDDYSDTEASESVAAQPHSWTESDEEDSELHSLKKKTKDGEKPGKVLAEMPEESTKIDIAAKASNDKESVPGPLSARSRLSIEEADSVWSDGEEGSLFSSADAKKPTLQQLRQVTAKPAAVQPSPSTESQDEWDDESSAISPRHQHKGPSLLARPALLGRQDAVQEPPDDKKEKTVKEKIRELVQELGLSSVSGSEAEISDVEEMPVKTSVPSKQPPLSARSSNWDSSVDEEPDTKQHTSAKQQTELLEVPPASGVRSGLVTPPSAFQSRESLHRLKDDNWDSESELAPPARKSQVSDSMEIDRVQAANKPEVIIEEDGTGNEQKPEIVTAHQSDGGDEDSQWDSESEMMSDPRQSELSRKAPVAGSPPVIDTTAKSTGDKSATAAATTASQMYADTDEEEEEEEESSWEKDRRLAKKAAGSGEPVALQAVGEQLSGEEEEEELLSREQDRNRQWQHEWEIKKEQMQIEAQEELRKEQEEEERRQQLSEADDDMEELLKPSAGGGGVLSPVSEVPDKTPSLPQPKQPPNQQNFTQNNLKQAPPCIESSDEEEGEEKQEHSRQLRLRREQAEKELEEARKLKSPVHVIQNTSLRKGNMNVSFDDEDDDTFNDLEVIGMDSPRKEGSVTRRGEEDGLSYSSTEHELSQHQDMETAKPADTQYLQHTSDSVALVRLQEQQRDTQKRLERERSTRTTLENRRQTLEQERSDLTQKLEESMRAKSSLEQTKIELEARIRSLEYQLSEEVEKRSNAEVLYNKAKEQLTRKEDQYTGEIEEKQKTELSIRNLQMELRSALSQAKQSTEEKEDLQRQLQHERNARLLQEQINEEQQRFQHSLHEDTSHASAEVISRLEATDEDRKQALDTNEKLKAELYAVTMELERQRARNKDEQVILAEENEELHSKIEEYKQDLQLNEDALRQYTLNNTVELGRLKTDTQKLSSLLDREKAAREKADTELDSVRTRLEGTVSELQREQQARSDLERSAQRDKEEWSRMVERRETEVSHLKQASQLQEQRIRDQESKSVRLENELAVSNATLVERTSQLATIQKELDQRRGNQSNMEELLRKEKEENARLQAKAESLGEQVTTLRHETLTLRTQLDEARVAGMKGDSADNFTNLLNTLRADQEKTQQALQEKTVSLSESLSRVSEQLRGSEAQRGSLEQDVRRLQAEAADLTRKCSVAEASLQVANRVREQTETERAQLRLDVDKLQSRLEDTKDRYLEAQRRVSELTERAERAEREVLTSSQHHQLHTSQMQDVVRTKSELEDALHKLEIENTRLEASLQHERQRVESLQRELQDSHQEATANKSLATYEAEDAKQMWETEVKSRSKLGLKMAQMEQEKQDAVVQLDEEKRKTKKLQDLRRVAETLLEEEKEKNSQLQKEVQTLKSHLKAAKKKLREWGQSSTVQRLQASLNQEQADMESTRLHSQLSGMRAELEEELKRGNELESLLRKANLEISKLSGVGAVNGSADNKELEALRTELEARSKWEVSQKLGEVNAYLQSQAQQQDRLYRMHETNEAELRKDFEKTRKELLEELAKVRANYEESLNDKANQEREAKRLRDLYDNEVKMREKLMSRLEKANLQAHQAAVLAERQQFRGSGLGQPMDSSFMYNNTWTLGKSTTDHGINDLTHKIRQELDKSIARHLEKGPHIDISVPPHTSYDDSALNLSALDRSRADYMATMKRNFFV